MGSSCQTLDPGLAEVRGRFLSRCGKDGGLPASRREQPDKTWFWSLYMLAHGWYVHLKIFGGGGGVD